MLTKRTFQNVGILLFLIVIHSFTGKVQPKKAKPEFRNFYGIAWRGTPHENLAYARQMGYDYVFYQKGMENDSLSNGLHFYIETPEYSIYKRDIETQKTYSPAAIQFAETHYSLMNNTKPFPDNIARGWFKNAHAFTVQLDFQQQKIITWGVDSILQYVNSIEAKNSKFRFGGFAWDVPQPAGDFWDTIQHPGKQITLKFWTGKDSGVKHPDVTHEFSTYSDGRIAYYKQLFKASRKQFPDAKFIMEPYRIFEDWINVVGDRADAKEVTPDILAQERFGTEFVNDERIFASGLIGKQNVMSTTPDRFSEADNRVYAASAAINGAWFSWYGRFGGTGDMPAFKSISEVPARLKLIRVLANWENVNKTPLEQRSWDGVVYKSPTAVASPDIIAVVQPETKKLFAVFLTEKGEVAIPAGKKVIAIFEVDDLFIETKINNDDIEIQSNSLKIKRADCLNKGYIFHLK